MGIKNIVKGLFKKRQPQPKIPGVFLPFGGNRKELFPGAAQYKEQLSKRLRGE